MACCQSRPEPIENGWDFLSMCIRRLVNSIQTAQQLRDALVEELAAIPQDQIRRCCRSMRRRITAVLDANRGHVILNFEIEMCHFVNWGCITVWFWFSMNKLARCSTHLLLWQMSGSNRNIIFLSLNILPEIFHFFFSPNPGKQILNKIQKAMRAFLWDGKKAKIGLGHLSLLYEKGASVNSRIRCLLAGFVGY